MSSQDKEELVKAMAKLIRKDPGVRAAVWHCARQCPNLMVQYRGV